MPDACPLVVPVLAPRGSRRRADRGARGLCGRLAGPNGLRAGGQSARRRQRSVLRTDFPARLASGSGAAKLAALAARAPLEQSPRVRSTMRASRADPEAALLGAAEVAPIARPHATRWARPAHRIGPRRRARPALRPAADCCPSEVCVRNENGALADEHHDGAGKGAGRAPRARLVRSREAQQHRRRAQRAPSVILAAIVRAELAQRAQRVSPRQPVLRASQGTPAKRGQAPGAPAAHGPRLCPRPRHARWSY